MSARATQGSRIAEITVVQRDEERDVELKPMQFFRLLARVFRYTKRHARTRNRLFVLVVIRSVQLPLLAWVIGAVINGPVAAHDTRGVLLGALGFLALAAWTQFTFAYRISLALQLGEGVIGDLRNDLFQHLQRLTAGFYNKMKVGRIISRMASDVEAIRLGVQDIVFICIVQLGQMIVCAIFMLLYDWVLFSMMLGMAPIIWILNRTFQTKISIQQREAQESFSRVTATLAESVEGIRVTQGFVRQDVNAGLFRGLVADHSRYSMGVARTTAVFLPLLEFNSQIFIGLLLLLGGQRVLDPEIGTPIGSIVQFFFLANLFFEPVRVIGTQYTQALTAMVGAERVFRLLDTPPEWSDPPDAEELPRPAGPYVEASEASAAGGARVEFRDLSFAYEPDRLVLRGIHFVAEPGQTVALVGHTGSGKSSIINLISKSYLPTSGELLIDGRNITRIRSESLHRQMGIVHQQNFLFEGTVLDNVRFARPQATEAEVLAAIRRLGFADQIAALPDGVMTTVGEGGSGLSLGQRQLICFARAFLVDPRIVILDEATSSIDSVTEARIQTALTTLLKGRTSFVVAHRLSTIRAADLILVLDHGEIVERGTHAELLARRGVYEALHQQFVKAVSEPGQTRVAST